MKVDVSLGFTLSSEEFDAPQLVEHAVAIEQAGFDFAMISDHFHPWTDAQGNSPFVWSTLGAIARETERIPVGTGVTCPIQRIHPAIVAQAAATVETLMPGRFWLGLGTGERLNEHITGEHWPDNPTRVRMLEEAVELIRLLWRGDETTLHGDHFTVDRARIYSLPDSPPPIILAAGGPETAELAGEAGDGLVGVAPDRDLISAYLDAAGDEPGPRIGQIQFCWGESEDEAMSTALAQWPNAAWGGDVSQEIAAPSDFEAIAELVGPDDLEGKVTVGPEPEPYLDALAQYADAGYDHIYIHQIGRQQAEAIDFFSREVMPAFKSRALTSGAA